MPNSRDITKKLVASKLVDYGALGKMVTELGPQLALLDDPWENFCGTMRYFIRVYRLPPIGSRVPELDHLDRLMGLDKQL